MRRVLWTFSRVCCSLSPVFRGITLEMANFSRSLTCARVRAFWAARCERWFRTSMPESISWRFFFALSISSTSCQATVSKGCEWSTFRFRWVKHDRVRCDRVLIRVMKFACYRLVRNPPTQLINLVAYKISFDNSYLWQILIILLN